MSHRTDVARCRQRGAPEWRRKAGGWRALTGRASGPFLSEAPRAPTNATKRDRQLVPLVRGGRVRAITRTREWSRSDLERNHREKVACLDTRSRLSGDRPRSCGNYDGLIAGGIIAGGLLAAAAAAAAADNHPHVVYQQRPDARDLQALPRRASSMSRAPRDRVRQRGARLRLSRRQPTMPPLLGPTSIKGPLLLTNDCQPMPIVRGGYDRAISPELEAVRCSDLRKGTSTMERVVTAHRQLRCILYGSRKRRLSASASSSPTRSAWRRRTATEYGRAPPS